MTRNRPRLTPLFQRRFQASTLEAWRLNTLAARSESDRPGDVVLSLPTDCMDTTLSVVERLLLDVMCMFGLLLFAMIVFFPKRFEGSKKPARMEQCEKCHKWGKVE
jgi:hypothetical protein